MLQQIINDPYAGQRLSLNGTDSVSCKMVNQLTTINAIFNETKRIKQLVLQYYRTHKQLQPTH